jgi:hypothetical protein
MGNNAESRRKCRTARPHGDQREIARNSVESKRPSELIDYATATPFTIDFLETAFAMDDNSIGI